jgi:hypothetical protein
MSVERSPAGASRRRRRVVATTAAGFATVVSAAIPMLAGGVPVRVDLTFAAAGAIAMTIGLCGWATGFTAAALALGAEYAVRLPKHARIDGFAVIEAVTIFATVELGLRALEARSIARPEPAVRRSSVLQLAAMLAGAAACAFVVLVAGSRDVPAPTAGLAVGLVAASVLLTAAELLRRRSTRALPAPRAS